MGKIISIIQQHIIEILAELHVLAEPAGGIALRVLVDEKSLMSFVGQFRRQIHSRRCFSDPALLVDDAG